MLGKGSLEREHCGSLLCIKYFASQAGEWIRKGFRTRACENLYLSQQAQAQAGICARRSRFARPDVR